ncbi:hypothetical protein FACS189483_02520 [Spirochaetia bacterium]|nr:hypothetical protein FACS189483_02520 [Spirochaetia bacterium]
MTPNQKKTAITTVIDTITKLLENAPDYGEVGIILTLHAGDVRRMSEQCVRTIQPGGAA